MRLEPVISEKERVERAEAADPKPQPIWERTSPPANPETDLRDLGRSQEKLELVLGR
jgi:hypothetical protein